jgi:hypothetical protein
LFLNTINTKKILNYGFLNQIRDLLPYFFCSLVVMATGRGLDWLISNNWIALAASLIMCPVIYFLLCYLFKLKALFEMASIVASNQYCPAWLNRFLTKL